MKDVRALWEPTSTTIEHPTYYYYSSYKPAERCVGFGNAVFMGVWKPEHLHPAVDKMRVIENDRRKE